VTVSRDRFEEFLRAELSFFAQREPSPLNLQQIIHASTPSKVASLVYEELPYQFAARIKHIEALEGWNDQSELVQIREIFSESFRELRLVEPPPGNQLSADDLAEFTEVIFSLRRRHRPVVALLAEAIRNMHKRQGWINEERYNKWADIFLRSRLATEMLTSHYVAVVNPAWQPATDLDGRIGGRIGIVDTRCNPGQICQEAASQVQRSLLGSWNTHAAVEIDVHTHACSSSQEKIEFSYIPQYLFFHCQRTYEK